MTLAKSNRRKSRSHTGSLTRCEIVSKRGLLVLNLQKPTAAKVLQMRSLSAFAFQTITLGNFEKKLYEASASVKRNTGNTICGVKELIMFSACKCCNHQRWSPRGRPWPRGHILKFLALASKVKSLALASRPQVLENWPVFGSRTALFFELLKFCGAVEKFFGKRFFVEIA